MSSHKSLHHEPGFRAIYAIAGLINIVLFTYIAVFLIKLEKTGCKCAAQKGDWRRPFIITYAVLMIIYALYELVAVLILPNPLPIIVTIRQLTMPLYIGLGVLFIIASLQYVHNLRQAKCACAAKGDFATGKFVLTLVAAIDAAVFSVIGVLAFTSALAFAIRSLTRV